MDLLVLGGTRFVGWHVVQAAVAAGHRVTVFHRGHTHADLPPSVDVVHGDRDGGLDALLGRTWDAAIDTSGYVPRIVRQSAELLEPLVGHYTFVSTVSVYDKPSQAGTTEDARLAAPIDDPEREGVRPETYGGLKVACERVVQATYGGRCSIVRPGLVAGSRDHTDRFTYWVRRVAGGGEVLAPGDPDGPVQFIDARDLADFLLHVTDEGETGPFTANGPTPPHTMRDLLTACRNVTGADATFTWVPDKFLVDHGVAPWSELPLWLPTVAARREGVLAMDNARAVAAGLTLRSLEDTVADVLAWDQARGPEVPLQAGMDAERERLLLRLVRELP